MNLYRSANKSLFLNDVANYLIEKFPDKFDQVKIILPSGFLCNSLQEILINKRGSTILPNIITLNEISAGSDEIFKIPSNAFGTPGRVEERVIIASIINSYPELSFNLVTALRLSQFLANLFYEIEVNELDIKDLGNITYEDQAQHWQRIYQFLAHAYKEWQDKITSDGRVTRAKQQKLMFNAEIDGLINNPNEHLVIAGEVGNSKTSWQFITNVGSKPNGHLILPPIPDFAPSTQLRPEDPLFLIGTLLSYLNKTLSEFKYLDTNHQYKSSNLDGLVLKSSNSHNSLALKAELTYVECRNLFDEAELVASKCTEILNSNPHSKIAIICPNISNKQIFADHLEHYGLQYKDLIGSSIFNNNAISLLLDIADFICHDFDLNNFFKIISHPEMTCNEALKLKQIILKHNRFADSFNVIAQLIKQFAPELMEYFTNLSNYLHKIKNYKFNEIFKHLITIVTKLHPCLWNKYAELHITDIIQEIYQSNWDKTLDDTAEFPKLFKELVSGGRIFNENIGNIILCQGNDAALAAFETVFLVDFNEGNYPPKISENPWLSRQMQEGFGLLGNLKKHGICLYDFYLNLSTKNVFISRSIKQLNTKDAIESSYLLRLKFLLGLGFKEYKAVCIPPIPENPIAESSNSCISTSFPSVISATDIETLIKAPYNFYAKKILGLRAINKLEDTPSLADFGNFFHAVAQEYTNRYEEIKAAKTESFINIAEEIILTIPSPEFSKNFWLAKIKALAYEFTEFEEQRRKKCTKIFTETKGELDLIIADRKVKIIAIADRIEIDKYNNFVILDYKTGAVPTKAEVLAGHAPQLIIEALILMADGFKEITYDPNSSFKLTYVKINNNKPYISTTEIEITSKELLEHKNALIKLVENYITLRHYPIDLCEVKYDDYAHLARR